jgi:hypothetical protein
VVVSLEKTEISYRLSDLKEPRFLLHLSMNCPDAKKPSHLELKCLLTSKEVLTLFTLCVVTKKIMFQTQLLIEQTFSNAAYL